MVEGSLPSYGFLSWIDSLVRFGFRVDMWLADALWVAFWPGARSWVLGF
jgi:hypothetical protein